MGDFIVQIMRRKIKSNEQEWYLSRTKWRVQLVWNGTVNLLSLFYGNRTGMWLTEVPPTSFLSSHVDSILSFTVTKQKQQAIQVS